MKKSNSRLLFFAFSCCWLFCATAFSRSYDDIIENNEIVIAVYSDFRPFSYLGSGIDQGKEQGIDVDLAKIIAKKLGVKLRLRWMTADESVDDDLRNNLWKGHYLKRTVADLMLRVPYDREYSLLRDDIGELVHQHVHMFSPFHTESWQVIYNSKKIESVETIAVFQYHDIGVEVDSIPQFYLTSAFRGRMRDRAKQFPSIGEAIKAMTESKVDAVMGLTSQISHLQSQLSTTDYPLAKNAFPMIGRQQWDIGMAVKADYRQLGYAVADIVESMIKTGEIEKIFAKYNVIYKLPNLYKTSE
ncbi:MAG: transporter substrate-binding domain-containing protein [Colwellia sp.]|nr:transporter substrate-binding domain-containing protein [Colwellia sp.]